MTTKDDYRSWQDKIFTEIHELEAAEEEPLRAAKERIWSRLIKPFGPNLTYDEAMGLRQPGMTDNDWFSALEAASAAKRKKS